MNRKQYHAVYRQIVERLLPQWIDYYREATDNAEDSARRIQQLGTSSITMIIDRQNTEVAANAYGKICEFLEERLQLARIQLVKSPGPLANRKKEAQRLYDFLIQFLIAAQTWGLANESAALGLGRKEDELLESLDGDEDYPDEVLEVLERGRLSTILSAQIFRDFQTNILKYVSDLEEAIKRERNK